MIYENSGNLYVWNITLNGSSPISPGAASIQSLTVKEPFIMGIQYYTNATLGSDLFIQIVNGSSLLIPGNCYNVNSHPANWAPIYGSGIIPLSIQIDPEIPIGLKWFVNVAPGTAYYLHLALFTAKIQIHDILASELRQIPIAFTQLLKNLTLKGS